MKYLGLIGIIKKKDMNENYYEIVRLFDTLKSEEKVEVLSELYGSMTDGEKDDFLEEVENY